ncbi:MAG: hypothetical protein PHI84_22260 [Kiritimatiellae bacterium]|nr:hypothetical protein [Kiritimatiellia bacterium]
MIRPVNSQVRPLLQYKTSAACKKGQVAVMANGLALPAAEGLAAAATVVGVFAEDAASGAVAYIYPADQPFEFEFYQGSTVDEGTLAMQGVLYDLYVDGAAGDGSAEGEMYLDLNDTDGAFIALSSYDNKRRVGIGNFLKASLYL